MSRIEQIGDATLYLGDCLVVMPTLEPNSVDSIVTDPPYGLSFIGAGWDHDVPGSEFWRAVLRVAKPGAFLLAFGGTRTFHRLAVAIEDAGWEIRDCLQWVYGNGFPKSHNMSGGIGTALKPSWEPVIMARKPLNGTVESNVRQYGTGALNIDSCRVLCEPGDKPNFPVGEYTTATPVGGIRPELRQADPVPGGRWPANTIHDGSPEVMAGFPETKSGNLSPHHLLRGSVNRAMSWTNQTRHPRREFGGDSGSAARFFYCAKPSKAERGEGNVHPTVKPSALMRYLVRLVTPPGGLVLDPFMGSGSTGKAAVLDGFRFVGIELDNEYLDISCARIADAYKQYHLSQAEAPRLFPNKE